MAPRVPHVSLTMFEIFDKVADVLTIPCPVLSQELQRTLQAAEIMSQRIQAIVPDGYAPDSAKIDLVARLYSLVLEHHGAILYLVRGHFDGSAFALARPLVEAAYRAHWLYSCAEPPDVQRISKGGEYRKSLKEMAELVGRRMGTGNGLCKTIIPYIKTLHGFTHGGLEQLERRFDEEGNVKPSFGDSAKQWLISFSTAHLMVLSVVWCEFTSDADGSNPRSIQIITDFTKLRKLRQFDSVFADR